MNWHLVNYSDKNYREYQDTLNKVYKDSFDIHSYTREWLETTEFYNENKEILDEPKGIGLWAWKPYIILDSFSKTNEGDLILYCDCKDMFSPGLKDYVLKNIDENDKCLLLLGNNYNREYTKRDCFILMDCDSEDYWNSIQLEAGFMVWKVCEESKKIIEKWLEYCLNIDIVSDSPSVKGEDFPDFKEHRFDQSILTNIAITEGLSVGGPEYRNYIECNIDYWYERNEKFGFSLGREIDSFLMSIKDA
jgi:hypothetical protein